MLLDLINCRWKVLDYRKVIKRSKQPLAIYYKLGVLLTNCLTCLVDGNLVSERSIRLRATHSGAVLSVVYLSTLQMHKY